MTVTELFTVSEAADHLRVKVSTIRAWTLTRRLPFFKVGRAVRIRREDVEQLLAKGFVPARPEACR